MNPRVLAAFGALVLVVAAGGGFAWWLRTERAPEAVASAGIATPGVTTADGTTIVSPDADTGPLPVPPFPPRIADGDQYDRCMTMIANDPEGAEAIATSWQATGGGDGATHCQALAAIASGEPENGAAMLEALAHAGKVQGLTLVVLLSQAAEARLMADQAEPALKDTSEALTISPDDPDLLLGRANAYDALDRSKEAMDDLNQALALDPSRGDALVLRASLYRRMEKLTEAQADIGRAIALDPQDAEALLERGILRQAMGDLKGARQDWTRAREVDPNSEAAELAAQNLTLLDSGPAKP
jgi:tetratricopeptide (TPR) repeat protein